MKPKYKRMIKGLKIDQANQRQRRAEGEAPVAVPQEGATLAPLNAWFVYILECKDGTFYTGITNNINRRIEAHNSGKGAKYTRTRFPVTLRYHETCANRSQALIRECAVKALPRDKKAKLFL